MMMQAAYRSLVQGLTDQYGEGEANAMARLLFEDLFNWHQSRRDREMSEAEINLLTKSRERLFAGEPLQYITERADFFGLQLTVSPAVLIPRPETEELVEWILEWKSSLAVAPRILDIGTGSGCIPLAIKHNWPSAEVWALDVSSAALEVARVNGDKLGLKIEWRELDILNSANWKDLPSFDIVISNPPYIPEKEAGLMPENVKAHEPALALFVSNEDPLIFYRTIMDFVKANSQNGSLLFFECNEFNAKQVQILGQSLGFQQQELRKDLQGKWRMWKGETSLGFGSD